AGEDHRRARLEVRVDALTMNLLAARVVDDLAGALLRAVLLAARRERKRHGRRSCDAIELATAVRMTRRRRAREGDYERLVENRRGPEARRGVDLGDGV